jgi:CubicO group peptidase (beta-lactamase class C family)
MFATKINKMLGRHVKRNGPGFAVLVMDGNNKVWAKGYGHARIADSDHRIEKKKITTDTVFDLASVSKQFTAFAILMLVDQTTRHGPNKGKYRRLHLSTKLSEFFPDIFRADEITIWNLLDHSSGLPDYLGVRSFLQSYEEELKEVGFWYANMEASVLANEGVIARIVELNKSEFTPGTRFEYCNTGYVVLAEIVRKITKKSLREFLQEEIFDHLKMRSTFLYDETVKKFKKHALCYRKSRSGEYVSIESDTVFNYIHGDGNVHSTIEDMMKWQKACNRIAGLGDTGPEALINTRTFLRVFDPLSKKRRGLKFKRQSGYAAGFHIYRFRKGNVSDFALHHGGEWLGFNSYLIRAEVQLHQPAHQPNAAKKFKDFSIVVLSNSTEFSEDHRVNRYTIMKELAEFFWDRWGLPAARSRKNVLRET